MEDRIIIDPKREKVRRVLELANQDKTYEEIGNLVGLSRQRVSQICLKHGIIRRPTDVKKENWQRYWNKKDKHSANCLLQTIGICTCGSNVIEQADLEAS